MPFSTIFAAQIYIGMKVLVLSESDASCGPMAAAFLRDFSPSLEVFSAGLNPFQTIDPLVVTVMRESLIDLEAYIPRDVNEMIESDFDAVFQCPDMICPDTVEDYRVLRDYVKNEAFLFYRELEGNKG